ncbi:DEAD/DEAH box helicase [Arthrobacter crystallopoietes]|uniref:DEAD/DEAH box helicase n=1 Tax=Crystallibacter crystallopoietes TaxID=37928 RepID=UPI00111141A7|nr:DEAD/DEAH box helicase [Arthrobacter crystallopoietes]QTG81072.1 DEAD/DEAH box helicase [Arthrobacter crystallopoietes]
MTTSTAVRSFKQLGVPSPLVASLTGSGITEPFPIQVETLPDTLAGRDVLGRGRTGSGKTLAFALPLVSRLAEQEAAYRRKPGRPLGLVLAPTRELATQINATIEPLAREMGLNTTVIYGGVSQQRQEKALRAGVDIVVACPGRLEDLMKQKILTLESVEITVLDEADHMADLGFLPVVQRLLDTTPSQGQRMLFSATLDNGVDKLVKRYLSNPLTHSVDNPQAAVSTMEHHVLVSPDQTVKKQLVKALASGTGRRILFTRTKHHARKLAKTLTDSGIPAVDLHGNLSQNARDRNLAEFSSGDVRVLVATDVAARGVHVDEIELVVHVDPPTEHKAYLHRSGRTARAGTDGTVVTIVIPDQKLEVGKLMKAAGVDVAFESVTASSPLVAKLVGDVAATVDPVARRAAMDAKAAHRGGAPKQGKSTGANAQRKRAARSQGGRGRTAGVSAGGTGRAAAAEGAGRGPAARNTAAPGGRRADADVAQPGRSRRPATGQRAGGQRAAGSAGGQQSSSAREEGGRGLGQAPSSSAPRRGNRRASAPASNARRSR